MYITNNPAYNEIIRQLYVDTFAQGSSAQYIDSAELQRYITHILHHGWAILLFEGEKLNAGLLYIPLTFDTDCPDSIKSNFKVEKCVYIAEVMVAEAFRGQGIGSALLTEFFKTVDAEKFTDVFIRVWDENRPALELYKKMGFSTYASIKQLKKTPDGTSKFVMNKLYLHKPLSKVV